MKESIVLVKRLFSIVNKQPRNRIKSLKVQTLLFRVHSFRIMPKFRIMPTSIKFSRSNDCSEEKESLSFSR